MYQSRTIFNAVKAAAAALALGGALAAAPSASAANLTLLSATMDTSNTAIIQGAYYPGGVNAYIGPVTFTATDSFHAGSFDFVAFCVDIYHDMYLGGLDLNGLGDTPIHPGTPGYYYHDEAVSTDSKNSTLAGQAGALISLANLNRVSSLLNYADYLMNHTAATTLRSHQLAGIQGAIWVVMNPGYTVDGSDGVNNVDYWVNKYTADAAVASYMPVGSMRAVYANDYGHQAFAYAAVPEAASWALMIAGFGAMGAVLRRRRTAAVAS